MTQKSVSITQKERAIIVNNIITQYEKLAKAKYPDLDFHKEISKRIYLEHLEKIAEIATETNVSYMVYVSNNEFSRSISQIAFENMNIEVLKSRIIPTEAFTHPTKSLFGFEHDEVNIPDIFKNDKNVMPVMFKPYRSITTSYLGDIHLAANPDMLIQVKEFNEKVKTIYVDLQIQLDLLIDTIDKCKSTKLFIDTLPNLVNLYPQSVQNKLKNKNRSIDIELTPEQQKIRNATASLVAASLLSDD